MSAVGVETRHHVGAVDDFEDREFRIFSLDGRSIGVVRTDRGFFAVLNSCPHQGAAICRGRVAGTMEPSGPGEYRYSEETLVLTCPWHRWEFDLESGQSYGQTTRKRLLTFDVDVVDGQVYVTAKRRAGR